MMDIDSLTPTQDERVMAALSHVSALLPFMGVISPIVIWVTQKEKSRYVTFHALQALVYQLMMIVAWFIGMGCYMCSFFSLFLAIPFASSSQTPSSGYPFADIAFLIPFAAFGVIFIGGLVFIVYGVVGAIISFQGKPFRYLLIGDRVERFMLQNQSAGK